MPHLCLVCCQLGGGGCAQVDLRSQMGSYSWFAISILVYLFLILVLLYSLVWNQCSKDYKNGIDLNPALSAFVRASEATNHCARVGDVISIKVERKEGRRERGRKGLMPCPPIWPLSVIKDSNSMTLGKSLHFSKAQFPHR